MDLKGNDDFKLPKDVETPDNIEPLDPMSLDSVDEVPTSQNPVLSSSILDDSEDQEPDIIDTETEMQLAPAKTVSEFQKMIATAKAQRIESIEATSKIICHFTGTSTPPECGYMIYQNIRVYLPNGKPKAEQNDNRSMEQVLFSKSKVQIKDIEKPKY